MMADDHADIEPERARDLLEVLNRDDPAGRSLRDLLVEVEDRQEQWRD